MRYMSPWARNSSVSATSAVSFLLLICNEMVADEVLESAGAGTETRAAATCGAVDRPVRMEQPAISANRKNLDAGRDIGIVCNYTGYAAIILSAC